MTLPVDSRAVIPADHRDLFTRPICGVLTTMGPDGQPQSSLVWVHHDGACARVNTTLERRKGGNMLADPRVSLLVVDPDDTGRFVQVRGDLADRFTLVFYDHRCNGRSEGAPVTSMTWENLTADANALRGSLGYERWAVLGHSFGGKVALEYALRCPDRVSHLVLLDTGGDSRWAQENAARVLAGRGFSPATVRLTRRWFNGRIEPREFLPALLRLGSAYNPHTSLLAAVREGIAERHSKARPEALIFAGPNLLKGWSAMDRLAEVRAPTLVMAGHDDFLFPPEHQAQLAAGIPSARLRIVERAGHNAHSERPDEVMTAVREFLPTTAPRALPSAAALA